jgi:acyl phosphate:glycerol-3-phosphate acyltransferase
MEIYIAAAIIAYLLGSVPFGYILVRIFRGSDIRESGSGNIGATNVARSGAKGLAAFTLLLDAAKGFAAVWAAHLLAETRAANDADSAYAVASVAAFFAILGHMYPFWLKFRGGKGVATAVGAFIALAPMSVLIVLCIFLVLVLTFRYISLGSIVAAAAFPVSVYLLQRNQLEMLPAIVAASALIIFRHRENIRRLLSGTEHRFGAKPSTASGPNLR